MSDFRKWLRTGMNRRTVLAAGLAATSTTVISTRAKDSYATPAVTSVVGRADGDHSVHASTHGNMITVGEVDNARNGFDPSNLLAEWDRGTVAETHDGRVVRKFVIDAIDKEIEIAPGVFFPAWTYNGKVPGPSLRATEGEHLQITFRNYGAHPHSMHFHGIHSARMDGVPGAGVIQPGEEFVYEFDAKPFGCHFYHCHAVPLKRHIHKGLYGLFVVDPDPAFHPEHTDVASSRLLGTPQNAEWQEFAMVMNAFDTNFDDENEIYAVNTVAHAYMKKPIRIERKRPVRIYLANAVEFDPINSFHLHGNFFDYYDQGTTLTPTSKTVDLIVQCQGQRGILEFSFNDHEAGLYMFHAHQSEFAELGWMSMFDVTDAVT